MVILYHALNTQVVRYCLSNIQPDVADGGQICFRDVTHQIGDVHTAHASRSNYSDIYFTGHE